MTGPATPIGGPALLPAADDRLPTPASQGVAPQRRYAYQSSPWRLSDVIRSAVIIALGLLGLLISWEGISRQTTYAKQVPWAVGGVGSGILFGLGMAGWVITGFRAVRRGQRDLWSDMRTVWDLPYVVPLDRTETIGAAISRELRTAEDTANAIDSIDGPVSLVTGAGMTLVHRTDCPLAAHKDVTAVSSEDAKNRGLRRCQVCLQ